MSIDFQPETARQTSGDVTGRLNRLRDFSGATKAFWTEYLTLAAEVAGARIALLLKAGPKDSPGWKRVLIWPSGPSAGASLPQLEALASDIAEVCAVHGSARRLLQGNEPGQRGWGLAVRVTGEKEPESWVAVAFIGDLGEKQAEEALRRLQLLAHLPTTYQLRQRAERSEVAVSHFASVLELVSRLDEHERYAATAMALCNELAARHHCSRVSLGWLEGDHVALRAISQSEKFDRKTEAAKRLEAAVEEALDQDEVIIWPATEGQAAVSRDHALLAEEQAQRFVCSLPLHREGEPIAVLTAERSSEPFTEVEQRLLALSCDVAVRRLVDLHEHDRWWGARMAKGARTRFGKLIGPEHTGAKLVGLALFATLAVMIFGRMDYRVKATFTLETENAAFLAAPFTGYIDEVRVEPGDEVKKGQPLATLDSRDLLLEEAAALADQTRYLREAEKANAADKIAEMRIAEAQAAQAKARLEMVQYRHSQSTILAPFDSVVIEGDLKRRIGAPVKQGDVLFKVTRLDQLYVECEVPETESHLVHAGQKGEVAFASMPKLRYPVHIESVEPVARTHEGGNIVIARCRLDKELADWWRPGMRGSARLEIGSRSPLWVFGHRTADFLKMQLWW